MTNESEIKSIKELDPKKLYHVILDESKPALLQDFVSAARVLGLKLFITGEEISFELLEEAFSKLNDDQKEKLLKLLSKRKPIDIFYPEAHEQTR